MIVQMITRNPLGKRAEALSGVSGPQGLRYDYGGRVTTLRGLGDTVDPSLDFTADLPLDYSGPWTDIKFDPMFNPFNPMDLNTPIEYAGPSLPLLQPQPPVDKSNWLSQIVLPGVQAASGVLQPRQTSVVQTLSNPKPNQGASGATVPLTQQVSSWMTAQSVIKGIPNFAVAGVGLLALFAMSSAPKRRRR